MDIKCQRYLLAKLLNEYLIRNDYNILAAMHMFSEDIGGPPEITWDSMDPEERLGFYDAFGPLYTENVMDHREAWNSWIEETMED